MMISFSNSTSRFDAANRVSRTARRLSCQRVHAQGNTNIPEKSFATGRPARDDNFSVDSKVAAEVLNAIDKGERYLAITGPPDAGVTSSGMQVYDELKRRGEEVLLITGDSYFSPKKVSCFQQQASLVSFLYLLLLLLWTSLVNSVALLDVHAACIWWWWWWSIKWNTGHERLRNIKLPGHATHPRETCSMPANRWKQKTSGKTGLSREG